MGIGRRTDSTHKEVVTALRSVGWDCFDVHALPSFVDIVAHRAGQVRLIEVKSAKGKLKPSQQRLVNDGWPIVVLRSAEDAARLS